MKPDDSLKNKLLPLMGIDPKKSLADRLTGLMKPTTVSYNKADNQLEKYIPSEHIDTLKNASKNAGMEPMDLAGLLRQEGGPKQDWKWTMRGDANPADVGVMQFNTKRSEGKEDSTYDIATRLFEKQFNRPFDRTSISDQITASGVWVKHIKELYPEEKLDQLYTRYHHGINTSEKPGKYAADIQKHKDTAK